MAATNITAPTETYFGFITDASEGLHDAISILALLEAKLLESDNDSARAVKLARHQIDTALIAMEDSSLRHEWAVQAA